MGKASVDIHLVWQIGEETIQRTFLLDEDAFRKLLNERMGGGGMIKGPNGAPSHLAKRTGVVIDSLARETVSIRPKAMARCPQSGRLVVVGGGGVGVVGGRDTERRLTV